MSGPVDTSSAREVARRLRSVPLDMTVDEFDAAGALIEALTAENAALRAALAEIAAQDPVDLALDPEWPQRIARAALRGNTP